ncbi:Transketolase [Saccharothrix espanaensis DSM 44229]|uniref:Transketolase n=1 Tax=Saccharothrix espanaensis (strain ATCC 51144 / DSM 44229 / JCM 9112 / NBRC 15066 / NRRL 15764) TaxID=1179773 RepID=K0K8D7_SACES|nr:Transketolase [Saccharothrix espanaensis DSM 44229]
MDLHETTAEVAHRVRRHVVDMCAGPEGGHLGGSLSSVDILVALYFGVLRVDPTDFAAPDRDHFLLSKGHAAIALYATLAERGFFPVAELAGYGTSSGRLMGHPVRAVPGVELPTGSLGHGLALGLGFALSARLARADRRSFVLLGDGELQEGACWEAALGAAAQRADNLVAVVDRNGLQLTGRTEHITGLEPLADKWRAFGWAVREVDGHDRDALRAALGSAPWEPGRPSALIARTVKGNGLPFAAGRVGSHYALLSARMAAKARAALDEHPDGDR